MLLDEWLDSGEWSVFRVDWAFGEDMLRCFFLTVRTISGGCPPTLTEKLPEVVMTREGLAVPEDASRFGGMPFLVGGNESKGPSSVFGVLSYPLRKLCRFLT